MSLSPSTKALLEDARSSFVDEGRSTASFEAVCSCVAACGQVLYFAADVGVCIGRQRHALKARRDAH